MCKYCMLLGSFTVLREVVYCFAENVELFVEKLHLKMNSFSNSLHGYLIHQVGRVCPTSCRRRNNRSRQRFFKQDSDTLMGTDPHRRRPPFDANAAPARLVKALAIPGKTGFTSFGKVDLPFHAPVSQQSAKTRRHSSTGLEFHDHQENSFTTPLPPQPPSNPTHSPTQSNPPLPCPEKKSHLVPFFSGFVQQILPLTTCVFSPNMCSRI